MAEEPKDVSAPKDMPEAQAADVPEPARKASEPDVSKTKEVPAPKEVPEAQAAESSELKRKASKTSEPDLSKSRQSKKRSSSTHLTTEKPEKDETKTSRKSHSPSHRHEREGHSTSEKAAKEETKASEKQETEGAAGPTKEEAAVGGSLAARQENVSPIAPSQPFKPHTTSDTSPIPPTANAGTIGMGRGDLLKERLVLAGVVFCFMCIVAIMVFMEKFSRREEVKRNLPCVGEECQEVVDFTDTLMDHSVNPCTDFYRHVCGRWIKNTDRPSSFMADVARNFSLVRHEAISQNQGEAEHVELRKSASVFYNSCLAFTEKSADIKATTDELFKALNISVTDWLKMTDPTQFFGHIVHLSLVNRFHALVSVSIFSSGADRTLQVYKIPAMHTLVREIYHASLAAYLGQVVKTIGNDDATEAVVKEVVTLDKNRGAKLPVEEGGEQLSLTEIKCANFPGKAWRDALEKDVSLPENTMVTATVAGSICNDLNAVLVDTKTAARPLYLLAQLAAQVLTYDYELSENREPRAVRDVCYRATASAFEDVWPHFLSGFLFINTWIEEVVDAYMAYITSGIKSQVGNWTWMAGKDRAATLEKLQKIHFIRFYGHGMSKEAVECSSGRQVTNTSFVYNMVHLNHRDLKNCMSLSVNMSQALVRQMLLGNELAADRSSLTVVLPPMFAVPPMYYRMVEDDKFINIAVLGTQFARKVVSLADRRSSYQATADVTKNATSSWSKGTLANYSRFQECYHNKSAQLHEKLNGDQFDDAFSVMAAMRIAFEGKRDYERAYVKKSIDRMRSSNAILYKRACLSLCTGRGAPQDANTLDYTTAYAACLFGAANAPSFAETFGCKPAETMSSIASCYPG